MKTLMLQKVLKQPDKIQVVKNLSECVMPRAKWKGKIWHRIDQIKKPLSIFNRNSKTKLNLSVFDKVFTNPDNPLELNREVVVSSTGKLNKYINTENPNLLKKSARPVKEIKEKKIKEVKIQKAKNPGGQRGRPASNFVPKFPKGKWTINQIAKLNKVEKYTINNFINHKNNKKNFKVVGKVPKKPGARGKSELIWQKIK